MRFRIWPIVLVSGLAAAALGAVMRFAGLQLTVAEPSIAERFPGNAPPMLPSDEAKRKQLQLAEEQGKALQHAVDEMTRREAHGAEMRAGDYLVGYAVEMAEGMYRMRGGRLEWQEPRDDENAHIEVLVRDGADGRFIPGLRVRATLIDDRTGREIGTDDQLFFWHPWLFHYGRNWRVPGEGNYTLRIRVDTPDFPRHDRTNGKRYADPVEVEFRNVHIKPGQKIS